MKDLHGLLIKKKKNNGKKDTNMKIIDVFDIKDTTHLRAYRYLCKLGYWPALFIEDLEAKLGSKLEFTLGWQIFIADKMVNELVDYKLGEGDYHSSGLWRKK
jgi:hypothetical protein